jgi:hypothetical protein
MGNFTLTFGYFHHTIWVISPYPMGNFTINFCFLSTLIALKNHPILAPMKDFFTHLRLRVLIISVVSPLKKH